MTVMVIMILIRVIAIEMTIKITSNKTISIINYKMNYNNNTINDNIYSQDNNNDNDYNISNDT